MNLPLGRVFECGWCGRIVEAYGELRVDYVTREPHVHLRLVKEAS